MKAQIRSLQVLVLVLALLWGVTAAMGATATPSTVNAAYGQSTSVAIHYMMSSIQTARVSSTQGIFIFNDEIIGYVHTPITTTFQTSEVITIPQNIVERVFQAGGSTFVYRRNFSGPPPPFGGGPGFSEDAYVTIRIVPGSVAAFSLRRIELYFDNMQKKNEVMVTRNYKGLKAYADIYYNGSGFLNGYWEVDGLIIERVNRFVPTGGKVTLVTPSIPDLPTFDPGYHIVKFIVTNPETSFEVPEMVYWVKGTEEPTKHALALIKPTDGMDIPTNFPFEWEKMEKASLYLISFAKAEDKTICFSALTRDTAYRIPPSVLSEYLSPGKKYLWSVKGFDTESNIIAESGVQSFYFKEAAKP